MRIVNPPDYAEALAEKWTSGSDGTVTMSIEGAIREALAKAAEVADDEKAVDGMGHCCAFVIAQAIRALGAAK